jgi:exopolyphosphatase/guanosine-5'-triphosphate,3'-diphosphate pyrophosphatase
VSDPPQQSEIDELAGDVRRIIESEVPAAVRRSVSDGVAVAGTPTSLAAIDQKLDPYDSSKIHGYRLQRATCERILAMLASVPEDERRKVVGLHPDRAPTIVAGAVILIEAMGAFELGEIEVGEHDILYGAALSNAH